MAPEGEAIGVRAPATVCYRGVLMLPQGRYGAQIWDSVRKRRVWLGTFSTAEEAAFAYDVAACELQGANAKVNFSVRVSWKSPTTAPARPIPSRPRTAL